MVHSPCHSPNAMADPSPPRPPEIHTDQELAWAELHSNASHNPSRGRVWVGCNGSSCVNSRSHIPMIGKRKGEPKKHNEPPAPGGGVGGWWWWWVGGCVGGSRGGGGGGSGCGRQWKVPGWGGPNQAHIRLAPFSQVAKTVVPHQNFTRHRPTNRTLRRRQLGIGQPHQSGRSKSKRVHRFLNGSGDPPYFRVRRCPEGGKLGPR